MRTSLSVMCVYCTAPHRPELARGGTSGASAQGMHLAKFGPPPGFAAKKPAKQRYEDHVEMHEVGVGFEGQLEGAASLMFLMSSRTGCRQGFGIES